MRRKCTQPKQRQYLYCDETVRDRQSNYLARHMVTAMSHQKVTSIRLFDLSAARDTIGLDQSILIHHIQNLFGTSSTALSFSGFASYLSSKVFLVAAGNE